METDLQVVSDQSSKPNPILHLTPELIEAMNRTLFVLVRAGANTKSIDQKRIAWEIIRYLRQESKETGATHSSGDFLRAISALMPSQVNVQVNVDAEKEIERERRHLRVKAETGLTAPIRERAAAQLAKLDAARAQQQPASPGQTITAEMQTGQRAIEAAEKPEG